MASFTAAGTAYATSHGACLVRSSLWVPTASGSLIPARCFGVTSKLMPRMSSSPYSQAWHSRARWNPTWSPTLSVDTASIPRHSIRGRHDMTSSTDEPRDEGGEAPCFAHLHEELDLGLGDQALGQLVHELADAVVIADTAGTIVFWNAAAATLFGWSDDDAVGRSLDLIIPQRLRRRHWDGYQRVMETGRTKYSGRLLEVPALHRDGHTLSVAFTVTLLTRPGESRPEAIAAVLRDDTARRKELIGLRERVTELEAAESSRRE